MEIAYYIKCCIKHSSGLWGDGLVDPSVSRLVSSTHCFFRLIRVFGSNIFNYVPGASCPAKSVILYPDEVCYIFVLVEGLIRHHHHVHCAPKKPFGALQVLCTCLRRFLRKDSGGAGKFCILGKNKWGYGVLSPGKLRYLFCLVEEDGYLPIILFAKRKMKASPKLG